MTTNASQSHQADDESLPVPDPSLGTMVVYDATKAIKFSEVVSKLSKIPDSHAIKHIVEILGKYPTDRSIHHCKEGCRKKETKCSKHNLPLE